LSSPPLLLLLPPLEDDEPPPKHPHLLSGSSAQLASATQLTQAALKPSQTAWVQAWPPPQALHLVM